MTVAFEDIPNTEKENVKRPMAVWVFGVLNIVLGCYCVVDACIFWPKYIRWMTNNLGEMELWTWVRALYTFVIGPIFAICLIVLGIGLLKMKKWARRGSVLLGFLIMVSYIYTIVTMLNFVIQIDIPTLKWWSAVFSKENILMLIGLVYTIFLIVFMKTDKVKHAFARIENESPVIFPRKEPLGDK